MAKVIKYECDECGVALASTRAEANNWFTIRDVLALEPLRADLATTARAVPAKLRPIMVGVLRGSEPDDAKIVCGEVCLGKKMRQWIENTLWLASPTAG